MTSNTELIELRQRVRAAEDLLELLPGGLTFQTDTLALTLSLIIGREPTLAFIEALQDAWFSDPEGLDLEAFARKAVDGWAC